MKQGKKSRDSFPGLVLHHHQKWRLAGQGGRVGYACGRENKTRRTRVFPAGSVCFRVRCYKKHGLRGLAHQQIQEVTLSIPYFLAKCNIHHPMVYLPASRANPTWGMRKEVPLACPVARLEDACVPALLSVSDSCDSSAWECEGKRASHSFDTLHPDLPSLLLDDLRGQIESQSQSGCLGL